VKQIVRLNVAAVLACSVVAFAGMMFFLLATGSL
jgi:hypothetical protein